jgi:hypothetical protein
MNEGRAEALLPQRGVTVVSGRDRTEVAEEPMVELGLKATSQRPRRLGSASSWSKTIRMHGISRNVLPAAGGHRIFVATNAEDEDAAGVFALTALTMERLVL